MPLRLAHRMLSRSVELMADGGTKEARWLNVIAQHIRKSLRQRIPIVIADNVAEYIYTNFNSGGPSDERPLIEGRRGDLDPKSLGCLLPPFDCFFVEWRTPDFVRKLNSRSTPASGWLVSHAPPDRELLEHMPNAAKVLICTHCFERISGQPAVSGMVRKFAIDSEGIFLLEGCTDVNGPDFQEWSRGSGTAIIALQAIGFMNYRNCELEDVSKTEGPPRAWRKRLRVPELKYHVLPIDYDFGKKTSGDRKTTGDRSGKSLHIRRGHPAHYVDDGISKGMFGKMIFGWFWISRCMVGSEDEGTVISSYVVNPPKDK